MSIIGYGGLFYETIYFYDVMGVDKKINMGKKELNSDKMKFGEWRPIGVCDNGAANKKQAKMFKRKDYLAITAPHVTRENWRKQPEVMKIIDRYAMDVASKSTMTQEMKSPVMKEVKLVGTILHYKKTPNLSNESKDGKLQLFQVQYKDKGKKRSWGLIALIAILSIILICVASLVVIKLSRPKTRTVYKTPFQTAALCESTRNSGQYAMDLDSAQQQLNRYLRTALDDPYHPSNAFCFERPYSIEKKEQTLVKCFNKSKEIDSSNQSHQSIYKVQECVINVCRKRGNLLQGICRGLN